jgi:hypothetical protein
MNEKNIDKARVLEVKGDKFVQKNKDEKAFECYQQALELDENRLELYDKLQDLHSKYSDGWDEDDFAYSVYITMKKQEVVDPTFKRIHAQSSPEYHDTLKIIKKMIHAKTRATETKYVEEIFALGEDAIYPLIDHVLSIKSLGEKIQAKKAKKAKKKS